jgi:hypothetical protein
MRTGIKPPRAAGSRKRYVLERPARGRWFLGDLGSGVVRRIGRPNGGHTLCMRVSSTPWPIGSIIDVTGILDRPACLWASTRNSTFARSESRSSTGRNCRRYSVRGKTGVRRNSTARHDTGSLGYSPACRGSNHKPGRCCWAADDSRAGSHSDARDRRVACGRTRRTRWLAAATGESRSIRMICAISVQHIRAAVQMRFKSRRARQDVPAKRCVRARSLPKKRPSLRDGLYCYSIISTMRWVRGSTSTVRPFTTV